MGFRRKYGWLNDGYGRPHSFRRPNLPTYKLLSSLCLHFPPRFHAFPSMFTGSLAWLHICFSETHSPQFMRNPN